MNRENSVDFHIGLASAQWARAQGLATDYQQTCPSTNDRAKEEALSPDLQEISLKVYFTDHQSAGRGRGTNQWLSSVAGSQLLSSWSFLLEKTPLPSYSARVGLAAWKALRNSWPTLSWSLKAPNDIYVGRKKVAGLLIENILQGQKMRSIVGLGLNVFNSPEQVADSTALEVELSERGLLRPQDWIGFLERWHLELKLANKELDQLLLPSDQISLSIALNLFPGLSKPVTGLDGEGNIYFGSDKKSWKDL